MTNVNVIPKWSYYYFLEEFKKYIVYPQFNGLTYSANDIHQYSRITPIIGASTLSNFTFQFIDNRKAQEQFDSFLDTVMTCNLESKDIIKEEIKKIIVYFLSLRDPESNDKLIYINKNFFFNTSIMDMNIQTVGFILEVLLNMNPSVLDVNFICWNDVNETTSSPFLYQIKLNTRNLRRMNNECIRLANLPNWSWKKYLDFLGKVYDHTYSVLKDNIVSEYNFECSLFDTQYNNAPALLKKNNVKTTKTLLFKIFILQALKDDITLDELLSSYIEMIITHLYSYEEFLDNEKKIFRDIGYLIKLGANYDFENFILSYPISNNNNKYIWSQTEKSEFAVEECYLISLVKAKFIDYIKLDIDYKWDTVKSLDIDEAKILKHKMREKYHLALLKGNSKHIKNNM